MDRVSLTKYEAEWIFRNVLKMTKLMETAATKDPKVLVRTTYKTLKSIIPKIGTSVEVSEEATDIILNRKQRLVLRDLVQSVHKTLTERVIPEYERRGASHKEYLDSAHTKATILHTMARKLK